MVSRDSFNGSQPQSASISVHRFAVSFGDSFNSISIRYLESVSCGFCDIGIQGA
jgi:hypothetical protein